MVKRKRSEGELALELVDPLIGEVGLQLASRLGGPCLDLLLEGLYQLFFEDLLLGLLGLELLGYHRILVLLLRARLRSGLLCTLLLLFGLFLSVLLFVSLLFRLLGRLRALVYKVHPLIRV